MNCTKCHRQKKLLSCGIENVNKIGGFHSTVGDAPEHNRSTAIILRTNT